MSEKIKKYPDGVRRLAPELVGRIRNLQVDGLSTRQIAAELNLAYSTVRRYRKPAYGYTRYAAPTNYLDPKKVAQIRKMRREGGKTAHIAAALGVSKHTVLRYGGPSPHLDQVRARRQEIAKQVLELEDQGVLSREEIAVRLGCSRTMLQDLVDDGLLPPSRYFDWNPTISQIRDIRARKAAGESTYSISKHYRCSESTINRILRGEGQYAL